MRAHGFGDKSGAVAACGVGVRGGEAGGGAVACGVGARGGAAHGAAGGGAAGGGEARVSGGGASLLEVRNLTVRIGELTLVDDVSFSLEEGERLMIVGPNGAGKSTLVNAIAQGLPYEGEVCCNGINARTLKPALLARQCGMLMQTHFVGYSFTVAEVVGLGRYAHSRGLFSSYSNEDARAISDALAYCGLEGLAQQSILTLSGGELQRTFLAQVIAQDPHVLILDEPTNHLDLVYQKRSFELLDRWLTTAGRAVLAVVHDLSLARAFGSRALLMDKGRAVAIGPPEEALAPQRLDEVYGMDVKAWMHSLLGVWE